MPQPQTFYWLKTELIFSESDKCKVVGLAQQIGTSQRPVSVRLGWRWEWLRDWQW